MNSLTSRIARRDMRAHRGRTLVAILLIAVPVAAIVAFSTAIASFYTTALPSYNKDHSIIDYFGEHEFESDYAYIGKALSESGYDPDKLAPLVMEPGEITLPGGLTAYPIIELTTADLGIADDEILINKETAESLSISDGDEIEFSTTNEPTVRTATAKVVEGSPEQPPFLARFTGDVHSLSSHGDGSTQTRWLYPDEQLDISSATSIEGLAVTSAAPYDPGVGFFPLVSSLFDNDVISEVSITDILSVVPYLLLAGVVIIASVMPIFAVATKRIRRSLGLLAVNGATPAHLRRVMTWQALCIGVLGAVIG